MEISPYILANIIFYNFTFFSAITLFYSLPVAISYRKYKTFLILLLYFATISKCFVWHFQELNEYILFDNTVYNYFTGSLYISLSLYLLNVHKIIDKIHNSFEE